jgi:hypothetical protein
VLASGIGHGEQRSICSKQREDVAVGSTDSDVAVSLLRLANGYQVSHAIAVAAALGVADVIDAEPRAVEEIGAQARRRRVLDARLSVMPNDDTERRGRRGRARARTAPPRSCCLGERFHPCRCSIASRLAQSGRVPLAAQA